MARLKKISALNASSGKPDHLYGQLTVAVPAKSRTPRLPRRFCQDQFPLVEPQINAEGVHVWPFDPAFPIDVPFLTVDGHNVRMNRHDYFEIIYLCDGISACDIQDRRLPLHEGDLAVIGSTVYHRIECIPDTHLTLAALFFEPDLIRSDGCHDATEYLTPFLRQDPRFPHIVPAKSGVPVQAFDLMCRIRAELPATTTVARLSVKTYLKMILVLLVKHYASCIGTVDIFKHQQSALERLSPLFQYLGENLGEPIRVEKAARTCGMSKSHFMWFFNRTTGQSFMAYLKRFRIERAQLLLGTTDRSISEISQEVGFCDQSYFGYVFKSLIGMTPNAYRQRSRIWAPMPTAQVDHALPVFTSSNQLSSSPSMPHFAWPSWRSSQATARKCESDR